MDVAKSRENGRLELLGQSTTKEPALDPNIPRKDIFCTQHTGECKLNRAFFEAEKLLNSFCAQTRKPMFGSSWMASSSSSINFG